MSLILTLDHAYSTAISDMKKIGAAIKNTVLPALVKIEATAPAIETVSATISPTLVNIERVGDAALGKIIQLLEDGDTAIVSGLTTALGVDVVNDVKAIAPAVKAQAQASGLTAAVAKS